MILNKNFSMLLMLLVTSLMFPVNGIAQSASKNLNSLTPAEKKDNWKLLFDGKTLNGWTGVNKAVPESWVIKDGILSVLPEGKSTSRGDIITTEKYQAFDLTFEFKLTPGTNSGLKYFVTVSDKGALGLEYQLLDDELNPDAKMGRDGNRTQSSLYDLMPAQKPKSVIRPMGEWNLARVVVNPDNSVQHYLNGTKVLEYMRGSKDFRELVAISKYKAISNFGEAPSGHLLLQDHHGEISFKNIKIKKLK